jgi:hypothetical protein
MLYQCVPLTTLQHMRSYSREPKRSHASLNTSDDQLKPLRFRHHRHAQPAGFIQPAGCTACHPHAHSSAQNITINNGLIRHSWLRSSGAPKCVCPRPPLISSHTISSHTVSPHLISSHLIPSHLISSHPIPSHLISSLLISALDTAGMTGRLPPTPACSTAWMRC